jgi:WD40 repeat protein
MRTLTPEQQYWQLWREGTRPDLAAFLAARPSLPSDDAAAIVSIDQYERWLGGDRIAAEEYARLLPDDARRQQALCDVVYGEYLLREQLGEHPSIGDYLRRFPAVAGLLSRQIELHQALAEPVNGDTHSPDTNAATPAPAAPPRIPGYALLEVIGQGGMGVVYKACQVSLDRDVALKVLPVPAGIDPVALERMHREAQITAKMSHPNIVTVFDAGTLPGWFYLAMEYVAGIDLHRLVEKRGPLPIAWACDYVRQTALGLQYAQAMGLVHRDIKPSNLIVSPVPGEAGSAPGTVKILDLGLARLSAEQTPDRSPITQVGTFMGTPDFIAPEQANDPRQADTRSDLYSLGCTFYYLLTGQPPFTGATPMAKVMQHHVQDATPVEQLRKEIPARVGAIVRRLLAKRPEDRYQTPADLVSALEMATSPESVSVPPASPRTSSPPRVRLLRSLIGHADWVKSVAFSGEGTWLASGGLDGTVRVWRPDAGQEVWRGESHAGGVSGVTFSDDGGRLASVGQDRFLCLYDVASRKAVWKVACHERNVDRLAFVLGGAGLLTGGHDGFLRVWDAATGRPIRAWQAHAGAVWGMAVLRDGNTVFTGGQDRALRLWDASTGRATATFPEQSLPVTSVEVCVEGKLALSGSLDGRIHLWDLPNQRLVGTLEGHTGRVTDMTLSPDRKTAVSASRDQTLRMWDIAGGTAGEVLTGHTAWVTSVTWSPDGGLIASGSVDRRVCLWDAREGR